MAEIFGAVASGAGLVSLSMQLLESAQKLKGFYDSARDAPETLEYLYHDLETMSLALQQFERYRQSDVPGNELLQRCIVTCERSVRSITTAVDKVDRLLHRVRFAGRVYMGFKEPEVKRLLQEMEHAKSSMSLAYMGYCQSWHMRETAKHATTLTLQSQRLEHLQDSLESGNTALIGHLEKLSGTRLTDGPLTHQDLTLAHDKGPDELRRKSTKRTKAHTFRLGLPTWLVDCVWEFGVHASASVWSVQVYSINIRPQYSCVFEVVRRGNVKAVRELLASGQLSLRDRAREWSGHDYTLLEIAASPRNLELCSFLLRENSVMHGETAMQSAFTKILGWLQFPDSWNTPLFHSQQEATYDLFVKEHGLSADLDDYAKLHFPHNQMQALTLTESSFRSILASQPIPFTILPFVQRFSTAINAIGWPADAFSTLLLRPNPTETVAQADENGKTVLHWAAAHFGEWLRRCTNPLTVDPEPHRRAKSYGSLASELLKMGSDVHALWDTPVSEFGQIRSRENDPFIIFLRGLGPTNIVFSDPSWTRDNFLNHVKSWGQMLVAGGHSLVEYIAAENHFLSKAHWIDECRDSGYGTWTVNPTELVVLGDGTLSVQTIVVISLLVWIAEPIPVPGAWPALSTLPNTIIWSPDTEDEQDGFQWSTTTTVKIVSDPHLVRPLNTPAWSSDLAEMGRTARQEIIFSATQDDHGVLANIMTRESRSYLDHGRQPRWQRAASLPPFPAQNKYDLKHESLISTQYHSGQCSYQVHKCGFDLRWSTSSDYDPSLRRCMQSHQKRPMSTINQQSPGGWEYHLLLDQNHIGVARRFAERFYPGCIDIVNETSEIATERARLMMGPRRPQDNGV